VPLRNYSLTHFYKWGAHWRHLVNTTQLSMCSLMSYYFDDLLNSDGICGIVHSKHDNLQWSSCCTDWTYEWFLYFCISLLLMQHMIVLVFKKSFNHILVVSFTLKHFRIIDWLWDSCHVHLNLRHSSAYALFINKCYGLLNELP